MGNATYKATEEIFQAFRRGDIKALRKLSNSCAESMATEDEEGMFSLSMISYVLGKIIEKPRYLSFEKRDEFYSFVENKLSSASEYAKEGDKEGLIASCGELVKYLGEYDERHSHYVRGLFDKAKLKIAARLYAQGFSLSYVVSITGANTNEVLKYIGQTLMFDRVGRTKSVEERLYNARKIFK
jgi:hypothetical protein